MEIFLGALFAFELHCHLHKSAVIAEDFLVQLDRKERVFPFCLEELKHSDIKRP